MRISSYTQNAAAISIITELPEKSKILDGDKVTAGVTGNPLIGDNIPSVRTAEHRDHAAVGYRANDGSLGGGETADV